MQGVPPPNEFMIMLVLRYAYLSLTNELVKVELLIS